MTDVPASYPGAPGRISHREVTSYPADGTSTGRIARLTPRAHMGVRWRHPGLIGRHFLHHALEQTLAANGLGPLPIYATFRRR